MDKINPDHYKQIKHCECIDITDKNTFCIGNVIKYIWRLGGKDVIKAEANKAIWYLDRAMDIDDEVYDTFNLLAVAYELKDINPIKANIFYLLANNRLYEAKQVITESYL